MTKVGKVYLALLAVAGAYGCSPGARTEWTIAIPTSNSRYEEFSDLLTDLFLAEGFKIVIIETTNIVEAHRLVARGEADFTVSMAHSDFLPSAIGDVAKELRTVVPLADHAIFIFHRPGDSPRSVIDLVSDSRIYLESSDSLSELAIGTRRLLGMIHVDNYQFVPDSTNATVVAVWGTLTGQIAKRMLSNQWKLYSMEQSFIDYCRIMEPRFERLNIPSKFSSKSNSGINTLLSTSVLISSDHVSRTDIYDLVNVLLTNRVFFTSRNKAYQAMREDFSHKDLNFPIHDGTRDFIARDEPTPLERHAEYYGLILSLLILMFGGVQAGHRYFRRRKKERIDTYFREYLAIKNDPALSDTQRGQLLESLRLRALEKMIKEQLEIQDYNLLSQTIQADLKVK